MMGNIQECHNKKNKKKFHLRETWSRKEWFCGGTALYCARNHLNPFIAINQKLGLIEQAWVL